MSSADVGSRVLPQRKAIAITAVVLLGFFVIDGSFMWVEHPPVWERVSAVFGFGAILVLQLSHSFPEFLPGLRRYRYATWALQALLTYVPMLLVGDAWGGMQAFLAASAVLVFPAALGWPLFGAVTVATFLGIVNTGGDEATILYSTFDAILIALIVVGLSRMSDLIVKLHRSRTELSRLAVAGERLRFARDLHDVLGFSLSAITLKCELAYRLFADSPAKAQEELAQILRTSRKALADVRSVSRGYREMSLRGEADAAVSMLEAAGIRTTLRFDAGVLPGPVDTVLATVLREGLTNMLRHSKAEQCEITAERRDGAVLLTLANDGVGRSGRQAKNGTHGGLAALDERIQGLGGTLAHGPGENGCFRLTASVPVNECPEPGTTPAPAASRAAQDPSSDTAPQPRGFGHADVAPRVAGRIAVAVLIGYLLANSVIVQSFRLSTGKAIGAELCMLALLGLQLVVSFHRRFDEVTRSTRVLRYGTLGVMALIQFVPYVFLGDAWLGLPGFVAGSALLLLPAPAAWPAVAVMTAATTEAWYAAGNVPLEVIYEAAYTPICALVVFGLSRMAQLASELHRSRTEIARLAVTTERLRFARDLHDLLGFSLSAITLKCELVRRLAQTKPVQAQAELTEVLQIARQALADVRTVAEGRQRMSLSAEAESATAMLAGVGIRATVDTDCGELPGEVETVLATMLREGLTNMLRHSKAAHCEITAERTAVGVRLTLVNDGVDGCAAPGLDSRVNGGSGIGNLTTRVNAVNGRLEAGARPDGRFELKAEVELLAAVA
ncbi:sensor histidine kinase [Streptomyces violascens]|uniref:Two-component sensor histidine kinase n=1 Tax=Streptomyces violascens TaxID=67381 RepID=A0ABQ3QPF7_9ACTN|nr:histidine kinase [Streptomyces violascens]GHI39147.1 two-component sensor histidine kinase [Streptomyces violascens]